MPQQQQQHPQVLVGMDGQAFPKKNVEQTS